MSTTLDTSTGCGRSIFEGIYFQVVGTEITAVYLAVESISPPQRNTRLINPGPHDREACRDLGFTRFFIPHAKRKQT